jgi:hypothetical protein
VSRLVLAITAFFAAAFFVLDDERASATTFCVPTFSPSCANAGGNVAEADLEKAMNTNGSDGVADQIFIAAGTVTENSSYEPAGGFENPGSIEPGGKDPLTVVGAGRGTTVVTSAGTGNIYLVALGTAASRAVTFRDLTIQVPATFNDSAGAAIQLSTKDTLERVEINSLNVDSDGVVAGGTGNLLRDVRAHGASGGTVRDGFKAEGELTVEDSRLEGVSWGLVTNSASAQLTARRVVETGTRVYGAIVSNGTLKVENSVFTVDDGIALYASAVNTDSLLSVDHLTAQNSGGANYPAIELRRLSNGPGKITVNAANSILRGFNAGYKIEAAAGPGIGPASLTVHYSNLQAAGTGVGVLDLAGNIDADPLFNADFSLPPGSPSVDAGDPAAGGLATDFLGAPRPNDGNGDGAAIRDQGSFEYQRPAPPVLIVDPSQPVTGPGPGPAPNPEPDRIAPQTTLKKGLGSKLADGKVRFRFGADEAGATFTCKLDRGKVRPCRSPKSYTGLAVGRHSFKVWATDAAGNKDATPAKRSFRVPG